MAQTTTTTIELKDEDDLTPIDTSGNSKPTAEVLDMLKTNILDNIGTIGAVGIMVAAIAFASILLFLIICCCKRKLCKDSKVPDKENQKINKKQFLAPKIEVKKAPVKWDITENNSHTNH